MENNNLDSNNENQSLNRILKMTIFIITFLILISIALIIMALFKKKTEKSLETSNIGIVNQIEKTFPSNCTPINITYNETYIALESKKCQIIKVIDVKSLKSFNINY